MPARLWLLTFINLKQRWFNLWELPSGLVLTKQ